MAFRSFHFFARFELRKPCVRFFSREVQAGGLVMVPRGERILAKLLAFFLALDILLDGFAHDPVRGSTAGGGEALDPGFDSGIELEAGCGGFLHNVYEVLPFINLAQLGLT